MKNPYHPIPATKPEKITAAQKALWQGFINLSLQETPWPDIKINHLCQTAHVARSTFYVYYKNTDELLTELENYQLYKLVNLSAKFIKLDHYDNDSVAFFQNTVRYIASQHRFFYAFLVVSPNIRFIKKWKNNIKYHLWEWRAYHHNSTELSALAMELLATQVVSAATFLLQHPDASSPSQLQDLIAKTLSLYDS